MVLAVTVTPYVIGDLFGYKWPNTAAEYGDEFGAVNALFSGLAFVAVIGALFMQREELILQRAELEQTREELRGQREQMEEQNKTISHQRFENTYFQLLRLHSDIVETFEVGAGVNHRTGRECFSYYYAVVRSKLKAETRTNTDLETRQQANAAYMAAYAELESRLGHYFRSLLHTIKFIADSRIENPYFYAEGLKAQLSRDELLLLFYHCISEVGRNFAPLIEQFSFFEHLPKEALLNVSHGELYSPRVFGDDHALNPEISPAEPPTPEPTP